MLLSQSQQQQQQQQTHKKKKSATRKIITLLPKEMCENANIALVNADQNGCVGDGAGDSTAADAVKLSTKEKSGFKASTGQLTVELQQQTDGLKSNANSNEAGSNSEPTKLNVNSNTKSSTKANEENKDPAKAVIEPPAEARTLSKSARIRNKRKEAQRNKFVAIDCEMVGVGVNGQRDMLARVSIVNKRGDILLDKFVKPREEVTDYRTSISGIRPHDIEHGAEFDAVQDEVINILQGKVLVGHAIRNDLAVLQIKHPYINIRDTSRYKPLCRLVSNGRTPSLKRLTKVILGLEIQNGEHNSVEDACAAMNIYKRLSEEWEHYIQVKQNCNHKRHNRKYKRNNSECSVHGQK